MRLACGLNSAFWPTTTVPVCWGVRIELCSMMASADGTCPVSSYTAYAMCEAVMSFFSLVGDSVAYVYSLPCSKVLELHGILYNVETNVSITDVPPGYAPM